MAPIPADLHDRRVEITGPVDRKMIVNALNSGAKVFMADFRGRKLADLCQQCRGSTQSEGPMAGPPAVSRSRQRQRVRDRSAAGGVNRPAAGLAPAGTAPFG